MIQQKLIGSYASSPIKIKSEVSIYQIFLQGRNRKKKPPTFPLSDASNYLKSRRANAPSVHSQRAYGTLKR